MHRGIFFFELSQSACPVQTELFSLRSLFFSEVLSEIQNRLLVLCAEKEYMEYTLEELRSHQTA